MTGFAKLAVVTCLGGAVVAMLAMLDALESVPRLRATLGVGGLALFFVGFFWFACIRIFGSHDRKRDSG